MDKPMTTLLPILIGNTPELTDTERESWFGGRARSEQEQLADLFWECATPEQRCAIYAQLRAWWTDRKFGVN